MSEDSREVEAFLAPVLVAAALLAACGGGAPPAPPEAAPEPAPAETSRQAPAEDPPPGLLAAAREVVEALAAKDFDRLAELVDPEEGVRFSPYALVEPGDHVTLSPEELRALARGGTLERTWGDYDASAEPIELSFREYFDRFVYDAPFLEEGEVAVDERRGAGTLDNAAQVYPDARIVEYHVPGIDPRYGGMDWRSLRLVFRHAGDRWLLIGIIHDQWTI